MPDYREKLAKLSAETQRDGLVPARDFVLDFLKQAKVERENPPAIGDSWGAWVLTGPDTLEHSTTGYELPLDEMAGGEYQRLHWIAQVSQKRWCTVADLGHLVFAVADLIGVQVPTEAEADVA